MAALESGAGGTELDDVISRFEKLEFAFRVAMWSGDVAGGTELDDEEISRLALWALGCLGCPPPVDDIATAGEVSQGGLNKVGCRVFVVDEGCVAA